MLAGTDVAKDASDMIMLDKDLEKIAQGVAIGRITYGGISGLIAQLFRTDILLHSKYV